MNPKTQDRLRDAAIEALQQKEDESALELLSLFLPINCNQPLFPVASPQIVSDAVPQIVSDAAPQTVLELPESPEGRDYHFWANLISTGFLSHLKDKDKVQFSCRDVYSWVEVTGVPLTIGDKRMVGGRAYWKSRVSDAFVCLCDNSVIWRLGPSSSNYTTVKPNPMLSPA